MIYKENWSCQVANLTAIYDRYFGDKIGTFVDVGAYDGWSFSNTWCLADAGWYGLCIEPIQASFSRLCELYKNNPNIECVQAAIAGEEGERYIWIPQHSEGVGATINKYVVDTNAYAEMDYPNSIRTAILTITLGRAIADSHIWEDNRQLDVLSIDVEGAEYEILNAFDFSFWQPHMCIIETHDGNTIKSRQISVDEINALFIVQGYKILQKDGLNTIYVREIK